MVAVLLPGAMTYLGDAAPKLGRRLVDGARQVSLFGERVGWSRYAVYTVTFFIFWGMMMVSSGLTAPPIRRGGTSGT